MKRIFLSIVFLFLAYSLSWAAFKPAEEHRVKNLSGGGGVCTWACLETIARHHGMSSLEGLAKKRSEQAEEYVESTVYRRVLHPDLGVVWSEVKVRSKKNDSGGSLSRVKEELDARKVEYKLFDVGEYPYTALKQSMDRGLGSVISVRNYPKEGDYHSIIASDYDDEKIKIIDSNEPDNENLSFTWDWFKENWDGSLFVLLPGHYDKDKGELRERPAAESKPAPAPKPPEKAKPAEKVAEPDKAVETAESFKPYIAVPKIPDLEQKVQQRLKKESVVKEKIESESLKKKTLKPYVTVPEIVNDG